MAALRERLRAVFDVLDKDGSGTVSTDEMGNIVQTLKLDLSPAAVRKMVKECDPDGSGEIDFEEFVAALKAQMRKKKKEGGGASVTIADVATDVGKSAFGWLNPLTWFADAAAEEESPPASKPPRTLTASMRYYPRALSATSSDDFSPTHRMKASQSMIQEENWKAAQQIRATTSHGLHLQRDRREHFLAKQQQRIVEAKGQQGQAQTAVAALKEQKRQMGSAMRHEYGKAWEAELSKKEAHAATGRRRVMKALEAKEAKMMSRYRERRRDSVAAGLREKEERAQRKEVGRPAAAASRPPSGAHRACGRARACAACQVDAA